MNDLVSRSELKKSARQMLTDENPTTIALLKMFDEIVDNTIPTDNWIPVSERLPEGKIDPMTNDFELVLCSTVWEVVRPYKFGKPIGHNDAHFWGGGGVMDDYVIAWKPMPEPYKPEAKNEND